MQQEEGDAMDETVTVFALLSSALGPFRIKLNGSRKDVLFWTLFPVDAV